MLEAVLQPVAAHTRFDYFDIVVLDWLILGLFRGRKRGVTKELLPLLQWIVIVIAAGMLYSSFSSVINQNTYFSVLWSNITAYLIIAAVIHLIFFCLKRMLAVKLAEWELFGPREQSLGMMAGMARFACMMLFGLALMNSCLTPAALAAKPATSHRIKTGLCLPTYGELEQDVLSNSFSGNWVQSNLKPVLIAPVQPPPRPKFVAEKSDKPAKPALGGQSKTGAVAKNSQ